MGFFDFLNKPIPGLNKPNPETVMNQLKEAVSGSADYARQGDMENALKILLKYKAQGWDNAKYVMHIAMAYYHTGSIAEAIECCQRAIELDPEYATAYITMGRALFDSSDYEKAASSYAEAMRLLEKKPENAQKEDCSIAYAWYGASLIKLGKTEEGESMLQKAEAEGYLNGDALRQFIGMPIRTSDGGNSDGGSSDGGNSDGKASHAGVSETSEWNTYTKTLFSKMPFLEETLRPGVSENSIKTAEAEIGFVFPEKLKALYLANDGDDHEALCGMMLGFRFLNLEELLSEWRSMKNVPEYADKKWLPFGSDNGGNFIGVNPDPDRNGTAGRIVFFGRDEQEETVIADSLGALFERFTRIIQSEDFYVGEYDEEEVILLGTDDVEEGSYLIDYLKSENAVK